MKTVVFALLLCLLPGTVSGADELFQWQTEVLENRLTLTLQVAPHAYVYADSVRIACSGAGNSPLKELQAPSGVPQDSSGEIRQVYGAGTYRWIWEGEPPFRITVAWQGCTRDSCLMPQEKTLLPAPETPLAKWESRADLAFLDNVAVAKSAFGLQSKQEFLAFLRQEARPADPGTRWNKLGSGMLLLLVLLGGLGLNLTPCVLPMIPVNLAIIGAGESRRSGFLRGTAYGAGMALAYGILGAVVVLTGTQFGDLNSSWLFNFAIALLFFILAAATAGWFFVDLSRWRIPAAQLRGGKTLIAFLFGGLSALLAGACVAPVVISVLLFSARRYQEGHWYSLLLPLLLGIGMALPWPFAGAGLAVLPKPGKFMVAVKYIFAVLICGAGIYYAWLGIKLLPGKHDPQKELLFLKDAVFRGKAEKRSVLVIFHASWCKNCRYMEHSVLKDPEVQSALKDFTVVKIQAEQPGKEPMRSLFARWHIPGLPAFIRLNP